MNIKRTIAVFGAILFEASFGQNFDYDKFFAADKSALEDLRNQDLDKAIEQIVENTCELSLENLVGKKGSTWTTDDAGKTITDTLVFGKEVANGSLQASGTVSGRHLFYMSEDKLVNIDIPSIWAEIDFNGNLQWSHGLTSKIDGGVCSDKVGLLEATNEK